MSRHCSIDKWFGDRDDLAGEHSFGDAGQLFFFIAFLAVWITDSFFFHYSSFLNDYVPLAVQVALGAIVLLIAGYLAFTGLKIVFHEVRKNPAVIRKGIYGRIRHPQYTGEILLYLGLLLLRTSLAALVVWIIIIVFLHYLMRYEEKLLVKRFGDEYRQYMRDVPMYFPRVFKKTEKQST